MNRKGIILAGGRGSRLYPATYSTSKQLIPIYDKPMIYYPLCNLMDAGIKDIMIICMDRDLERYQKLFQFGRDLGLDISYEIQDEPQGIAQAFILAEDFIGNDHTALILGDNLFHGNFKDKLDQAHRSISGASIFAYHVNNPSDYGVIEFYDRTEQPLRILEKPQNPKSNFAVTGLYFYDNQAVEIAKNLKPSARGELEITDLNQVYLDSGELEVIKLSRGVAWLDTGSHESMLQASTYVEAVENRTGLKIGCIEETAFRNGLISSERLLEIGSRINNQYGDYLVKIAQENL